MRTDDPLTATTAPRNRRYDPTPAFRMESRTEKRHPPEMQIMNTATSQESSVGGAATIDTRPVGGPVWVAWREGTLTRAAELEALSVWVGPGEPQKSDDVLVTAIQRHLEAAREAARAV